MVSTKKLVANRANAKKSTGPKSAEGKAVSRLNSWKHGLTADRILIGGEDAGEFETLRAELMEEWKPKSRTECALVERIAVQFWRLYRVPLFEAAVLEARQSEITQPRQHIRDLQLAALEPFRAEAKRLQLLKPQAAAELEPALRDREDLEDSDAKTETLQTDIGLALIRDSEKSDALGKVLRYEATISNGLSRTMSMLISLQAAREAREEASKEITVFADTP